MDFCLVIPGVAFWGVIFGMSMTMGCKGGTGGRASLQLGLEGLVRHGVAQREGHLAHHRERQLLRQGLPEPGAQQELPRVPVHRLQRPRVVQCVLAARLRFNTREGVQGAAGSLPMAGTPQGAEDAFCLPMAPRHPLGSLHKNEACLRQLMDSLCSAM